jgi:hypothetical protein
MIVEISAGPDFEVAVPRTRNLVTVMNATPQMGDIFSPKGPCTITQSTIGQSQITSDDNINSQNCIGERVTSFRQLLKVAQPLARIDASTSPTSPYVNITPFGVETYYTDAVNLPNTHTADLYSLLSTIYVFSRGGVRIKTLWYTGTQRDDLNVGYLHTGPPTSLNLENLVHFAANDASGSSLMESRSFTPTVYELATNTGLEAQIPAYGKYHSRINSQHYASVSLPYPAGNYGLGTEVFYSVRQNVANGNSTRLILRSGSDDCNFGTFKSIPPLTEVTPAGGAS